MKVQNELMTILALALGLGACNATDGRRAAIGAGEGGDGGTAEVCEPTWQTDLRLTTGDRETIGHVTFNMTESGLTADVYVDEGWGIGDTYLGVGIDGDTPTWVAANTEPWVTGWLDHVQIVHPLDGASCGADLKIRLQAKVRQDGATGGQLASAFGEQDRGEWGWGIFRPLCCDRHEPDAGVGGCTFTQGYWKNHPEAWPVDGLTLGDHTYTKAELLALLETEVSGDASIALAHQLITAELNVLAGASPVAAIAEAQAWMSAHDDGGKLPFGTSPGSAEHQEAMALNERLTDFNEGKSGPGHCEHMDRDMDEDVDEDMDEDMDEDVDEDMDEGPNEGSEEPRWGEAL